MSKKRRYAVRVTGTGYLPADTPAVAVFRDKHHTGDLLFVEFTKPRQPGFHRLAHALGDVIAANIEAFAGVEGHDVLKRLQIEADVGCDHMAVNFPGLGPCTYRTPKSLSYESMDEDEFEGVIRAMCDYVQRTYWQTETPERILKLADEHVRGVAA